MFGGGSARLTFERVKRTNLQELAREGGLEEAAESEEGISIQVNLPRKKIKSLEMLSGGERALVSIALLFALSQVNPPPFLVLDETDAALDESNSRRYGEMVENLAKHSQLVLVTHNRETMAHAGILYGVTMGHDGVSRLLSIRFDEAVAYAA
jgi:chromosome segregation protein